MKCNNASRFGLLLRVWRDYRTRLVVSHVVLVVFTVVAFTSCGRSAEERQRMSCAERARLANEERLALKVAVLPTIDCLPMYVAKERGMYEARNVDIRLKCFTAQMDCDTAIAGKSVDGMVSDLVRAERLKRDVGVRLDYISSTGAAWQLLSAHRARIKRMEQLSDKMVAMTRHSATDALTSMALGGVKAKSQVFRIQVNDVNIRLAMLLNNEIDAAWLQEPLATKARLHGAKVLAESGRLGFAPGVIAFRSDAVNDIRRKHQMEVFVNAYNAACDSINKNGVQSYADILNKYCNVDASVVKALPRMRFGHVARPRQQDIDRAAQQP